MRKVLYAALTIGAFLCACSDKVADGGISEETNTLAGILRDVDGNLSAGITVVAQHLDYDDVVFVDTTDSAGRFTMSLDYAGTYGVSAKSDTSAYYGVVLYNGHDVSLSAQMVGTVDVQGYLQNSDGSAAAGGSVSLPGSAWEDQVDFDGKFILQGVPEGMYAIEVKSADAALYDDAFYVVKASSDGHSFEGPLSQKVANSIVESGVFDYVDVNGTEIGSPTKGDSSMNGMVLYQPKALGNGALTLWHFDSLSIGKDGLPRVMDALESNVNVLLYGNPSLSVGVSNNAVVLNGPHNYGVIEDDHEMFDGLSEFTLEAWVNVASIEGNAPYRKNFIGKIGFGEVSDSNVFSLAIVHGECGASEPSFGFFLADGAGDSLSCENAVIADTSVIMNEWIYVVAVWNGTNLKLYLNGQLSAVKSVAVPRLTSSSEPIFFGKESINLKLDEVRMLSTAIESADVFYRFKLKGGAL